MINDSEIWDKFKKGDNDALNMIYSENSKRLYRFGLKLTHHHTIIEDAIQDLFSDLVRNRKKLGDTENINFYLLKSFKRRLVRQLQKEQRYHLKENNEGFGFQITYSIEHDIILQEKAHLKLHSLHQAINHLSPRQKEAIYHRFTEELEYPQIAEIMDMSVEACRNLISKAIKSLKNAVLGDASLLLFIFGKQD